jgi:hypothetical protein
MGDFRTTHIQDNATHYETADKIEVKIAYWSKDTWSLRDRTSYRKDQFLLQNNLDSSKDQYSLCRQNVSARKSQSVKDRNLQSSRYK